MKKKSLAGTFILFNFFFIGSGYYYDEEENASRKLKKKLLQNSCGRMVSWKGGDFFLLGMVVKNNFGSFVMISRKNVEVSSWCSLRVSWWICSQEFSAFC